MEQSFLLFNLLKNYIVELEYSVDPRKLLLSQKYEQVDDRHNVVTAGLA